MQPPLSWPVVSPLPRIEAVAALRDLINRWGDLVDFQKYSDTAVMLRAEVAGPRLPGFWEALSGRFRLLAPCPGPGVEEVTVVLSVTFPDGTGDLVHEVPSVPG